jgi:ATP phosphoribosyltransferase
VVSDTGIITLALSKGRIFDETLPLLKAAGIEPVDDPEKSRKLVIATNRADVKMIIVRASDVPTYVQYGAADLGIAGFSSTVATACINRSTLASPGAA